MQGRQFLHLAQEIIAGGTEVHWRGTVGRAYYALMLECREALLRWGFLIPSRDNVHHWVRMRFYFPAHPDLRMIGGILDTFGRLRNGADYDLSTLPAFLTDRYAQIAIREVARGISVLDAMDTDPIRRAGAIAAIIRAFP